MTSQMERHVSLFELIMIQQHLNECNDHLPLFW